MCVCVCVCVCVRACWSKREIKMERYCLTLCPVSDGLHLIVVLHFLHSSTVTFSCHRKKIKIKKV